MVVIITTITVITVILLRPGSKPRSVSTLKSPSSVSPISTGHHFRGKEVGGPTGQDALWKTPEEDQEEALSSEISVDAAAAAAVISELKGFILTLREEHKNDTEDAPRWTTWFCFTPDWLWL